MEIPKKLRATSAKMRLAAVPISARPHEFPELHTPKSETGVRSTESSNKTERAQESNYVPIDKKLASLKTQAVEAVRAYVLATVDHLMALSDDAVAPASVKLKIGHIRRQGLSVSEQLGDFIGSAGHVNSILTNSPNRTPIVFQQDLPAPKAQDDSQCIRANLHKLTAREKNVLELLVRGLPNKQIAFELGISTTTAKAHMGSIMRKLNVSNRARVIALLANIDLATDALLSSET